MGHKELKQKHFLKIISGIPSIVNSLYPDQAQLKTKEVCLTSQAVMQI